MSDLPEWPEPLKLNMVGVQWSRDELCDIAAHETERHEAAMARLHYLVSAVTDAVTVCKCDEDGGGAWECNTCKAMRSALATIGPLPEPQ